MTDRGYIVLLHHLARPSLGADIPLSTVQASIAHHLAHAQPTPTALAGAIAASPVFRPPAHAPLSALLTAFRHALHLKVKALREEARASVFTRGVSARTGEWGRWVVEGLQGGHAAVRLVCVGGLLLGMEDLESTLKMRGGRARGEVEREVVLALAEVVDLYERGRAKDWERDFRGEGSGEDPLSLALLLSAQFFPLVDTKKLEALPLPLLSDLVASVIESTFHGGSFLPLSPSLRRTPHGLSIPPDSELATTLRQITSSPYLAGMGPLTQLLALLMRVLAESRPLRGWPAMAQALWRLEESAQRAEAGWAASGLASLAESDIAPESQPLMKSIWDVLKSQLFMTVLLTQSILSTLVYTPYPRTSHFTAASTPSAGPSTDLAPCALAGTALAALGHLSFVIAQFGGIAGAGGFRELRRAAYMALDVLAADEGESARFVADICHSFDGNADDMPEAVLRAKKAYALACVEQLVSVFDDARIRADVLPLCAPYLSDPTHRETYESAHSVMLAIFAAYAQKAERQRAEGETYEGHSAAEILPFYVQCLIENSADDHLSTQQLCLAYAAVVRSASARRPPVTGDATAWFCIKSLLDALQPLQTFSENAEQVHRLHLTLIAAVPSVSLRLLPRLLANIKTVVTLSARAEDREELVEALFKELCENVGDREKEWAMKWWYEHREELLGVGDEKGEMGEEDGRQLAKL